MNEIKNLHQEASDTLWEIGVKRVLIKGKQETVVNYKKLRVPTDYLEQQIVELKAEKAELKIKLKDQLSKLLTLTEKL